MIILTGLPSNGKTTLCSFIKTNLNHRFCDLDWFIKKLLFIKINFKKANIFFFRNYEKNTINFIKTKILCLGGGSFENYKNFMLLIKFFCFNIKSNFAFKKRRLIQKMSYKKIFKERINYLKFINIKFFLNE
ncbi:shikimate kinase [Candidatus Vidania fulgoroideorum]